MAVRYCAAALIFAVVLGSSGPASAAPHWPLFPGGAFFQRHPAYQPNNPNYHVQTLGAPQPASSGQYPWYGSGWGVPTYNWGHFGAPAYPTIKWHKGYYRDFLQWGQWRRY